MQEKILIEFDLAGAEWVVTAHLAKDPKMIEVAHGDESPHAVTGSLISGAPIELVKEEHGLVGSATDPNEVQRLRDPIEHKLKPFFAPRTMAIRQGGKKSNHGLNYGMRYKRFALENEMPENDAKRIVGLYSTTAYPGLRDYWKGIDAELRASRTLTNCFGRKRRFLDEWGPDLQLAAYSFKPQSTVFDICRKAMETIYNEGGLEELLRQVHDSVGYQFPLLYEELAQFIHWVVNEAMSITVDYGDDPFKLGVDTKIGFNFGHMQKLDTSGTSSDIADRLRATTEDILKAAA